MAGARRCTWLRFNSKLHYVDEFEYVFYLLFIELYLFFTSVGLVVASAAGILRFRYGGRAESHHLGLCRYRRIAVAQEFVTLRFPFTIFSVDVSPLRGYGLGELTEYMVSRS